MKNKKTFNHKEQGDINENGVGDVCECYADANGNQRVGTDDVGILIEEWATMDCDPDNETKCCRADANENGRVGTGDVGLINRGMGQIRLPISYSTMYILRFNHTF